MAKDREHYAHLQWLGYVQPVGLVVSIPALLDAQAQVNANTGPLQQRFLAALRRNERDELVPEIADFAHFAETFLNWRSSDLVGVECGEPIPDALEVPLVEYQETLRPTYAVKQARPEDPAHPWLMLVVTCPTGTDLDKVAVDDERRWQAHPQARLERLLRETQVPIGLLVNSTHVRLVYAPRGETSGYLTFSVTNMAEVAGRPILAAFDMLLSAERVFNIGLGRRQDLASILADSRKHQNVVSTELAEQVLAALNELLRGFQAANDDRRGHLLEAWLKHDPNEVYHGLLTVLMRLVFLLYAEDRELLSSESVFINHYSLAGLFERLRSDDGRWHDTMNQRFGAWDQLLALFRIVYDGASHGNLHIPGRQGYLFDPDRYPFLEGRAHGSLRAPGEDLEIPRVSDGVVYRVLAYLLILDGERLSYRTLDVEQIGSVYETVMGFNLEVAQGRSIAIKSSKSGGAPTIINLEALLEVSSANRARWIKEEANQSITGQAAEAMKRATTVEELCESLDKKIAWKLTPGLVPRGAMILQPSDERRRSGSHYTPRSLTEPIVRTTLQPILARLGQQPTPGQILELKICDPAMGSAAFLVEACRQMGDELVRAWHVHNRVPKLPPDEDELLHARRLIAQRCLYGVDRNPMAVDLAKLSLWLATLAKDHPFTFLDHSLRHGDSLVGLSRRQIVAFHWLEDQPAHMRKGEIEDIIHRGTSFRRKILEAHEDAVYADQLRDLVLADEALDRVRRLGDLVIAAWFGGEKPAVRKKLRQNYLELVDRTWGAQGRAEDVTQLLSVVRELRSLPRPIVPFHWEIEFPEVFGRESGGFDAIVGNPPFAGKNTLINSNPDGYLDWLKSLHEDSHGNADLVAHFFRRAFNLLRSDGCFGLIATNTIGQGDTRSTGLRWICTHGGTIYAARKRYMWPGLAAVVVSVVHVCKGTLEPPYLLDGCAVQIITAYLLHSGGHESPSKLQVNDDKSFQGSIVLGMGFTFDDTDTSGVANPLALMSELIAKDRHNAERIFPYIGGDETANSPTHCHHRFVINFGDIPLQRAEVGKTWQNASVEQRNAFLREGIVPLDYSGSVAADYPDLLTIVELKIKGHRASHSTALWWHFERLRAEMYDAMREQSRVLAINCGATPWMAFAFLGTGYVFANTLTIVTHETYSCFALLQSRVHEVWARREASSMKDDLRYTPTDCYETFPFPVEFDTDVTLEAAGNDYYKFRAALMVKNNEGMTKTCNRSRVGEKNCSSLAGVGFG